MFFFITHRFQIINNVDRCGTVIPGGDTKPTWYIVMAVFSAMVMHVPYVIQFYIVPCESEDNLAQLDCWVSEKR